MQFHIEIRLARLRAWLQKNARINDSLPDKTHVHSHAQILAAAEQHLGAAHAVGLTLYERWLRHCRTRQ